jgi:flagellar biosynthetic protein FliQ
MELDAVESVRVALMEALVLALPILGSGLVIGLIISLFQAVTQIQEQTLVFVPKIIVMLLVAIVLLSWLTVRMSDFAIQMFSGQG